MQILNLPKYDHKITEDKGNLYIYDIIRRKYVRLSPEEWVRQNFVRFMISEKKYPQGLIAVEMQIKINNINKRCDIIAYKQNRTPLLIVECKAAQIAVSQDTFNQVAVYNWELNAEYIAVTNGINHFFCKMDYKKRSYSYLKELPKFGNI